MKFVEVNITANSQKTVVDKRCTKCDDLGFICLGIIKERNCTKNLFTNSELRSIIPCLD